MTASSLVTYTPQTGSRNVSTSPVRRGGCVILFRKRIFDESVEDITDNEEKKNSGHAVFLNLCHALSRRQVTKEFGGGFSEEGVRLVR